MKPIRIQIIEDSAVAPFRSSAEIEALIREHGGNPESPTGTFTSSPGFTQARRFSTFADNVPGSIAWAVVKEDIKPGIELRVFGERRKK